MFRKTLPIPALKPLEEALEPMDVADDDKESLVDSRLSTAAPEMAPQTAKKDEALLVEDVFAWTEKSQGKTKENQEGHEESKEDSGSQKPICPGCEKKVSAFTQQQGRHVCTKTKKEK